MQRAYEALEDFLSIIASFKARKTLCVATSALRDAPNKGEFLQKVRNGLGLAIKVIDGEREAYLGAIACANLLPLQQNALSIDIGGGSTEFSLIHNKDIRTNISLNLGTVRLKELFFDFNNIDGAKKYIDTELEKLNGLDATRLIGIGGTFRAISYAIQTNSNHPLDKLHAYKPNYKEFELFLEKILDADEDGLKKLGIKSSRFDVIKPGSLILLRVLKRFNIKELITSGVGVREGAFLADLLRSSRDKFPANFNPSVRYLLDAHIDDLAHANLITRVAKELFDLTYNTLKIEKKYRYELGLAAKLCMSGSTIHFYSYNKHSYELIEDALEFGFTHEQIVLIATLARFSKRKLPSSSHAERFESLLPDVNQLNALSYLLSLSVTLLSHRPRNIDFTLRFENNILEVVSKKSLYLVRESVEKLEVLKNSPIKISFL
jgi:exopolyphosphatase/guanosine-5'-triphosphate,3'-diphosphate pyrophosphatase